jgi:hypothetical protein
VKCDILVSTFAFEFNLYRYNTVVPGGLTKMSDATVLKVGGGSVYNGVQVESS